MFCFFGGVNVSVFFPPPYSHPFFLLPILLFFNLCFFFLLFFIIVFISCLQVEFFFFFAADICTISPWGSCFHTHNCLQSSLCSISSRRSQPLSRGLLSSGSTLIQPFLWFLFNMCFFGTTCVITKKTLNKMFKKRFVSMKHLSLVSPTGSRLC